MFENFLDLFERLVIAVERIAAYQGPSPSDPAPAAAPAAEDKPKRTRKPKEEPVLTTAAAPDFLAALTETAAPVVVPFPTPAPAPAPAPVPPATEGIPAGAVERKNVSAVLITV